MAYATIEQVESGFRDLTGDEKKRCKALLDEASIIIDAYNCDASENAKQVVSCRMVRRAIGDSDLQAVPLGSSQGSVSAGGYTQSWTLGTGSAGELYLGKVEKKLLRAGNKIGTYSPVEGLVKTVDQRD